MVAVESRRVAKFGVVGGSGLVIYTGLVFLLTGILGWPYLIAVVLGWEIAVLSMFALHEIWTFRDVGEPGASSILRRAMRFNLIRLVSLPLNLAVILCLTELVGTNYLVSVVIAVAVVVSVNYLVSSKLIWKRQT